MFNSVSEALPVAAFAALLAASIIANTNPVVKKKLNSLRLSKKKAVKKKADVHLKIELFSLFFQFLSFKNLKNRTFSSL